MRTPQQYRDLLQGGNNAELDAQTARETNLLNGADVAANLTQAQIAALKTYFAEAKGNPQSKDDVYAAIGAICFPRCTYAAPASQANQAQALKVCGLAMRVAMA